MMFGLDPTVGALSPKPHEVANPTLNDSDGIPKPSYSSSGQLSDSNGNLQEATDQLQSPLMQLLSIMASYPHPEAEADLNKLRHLINTDKSQVNGRYSYSKTTPLHIAARRGLVGAVDQLLEAGAKLVIQDRESSTPLMTATENEQVEIMEKLLSPRSNNHSNAESQLEIRDNLGRTPLLKASINGFLGGVKLLIAKGANRNVQTSESGSTPLIAASSWGHQDVVKTLLDTSNPKSCADLKLQDANGGTALHAAVVGAHFEIAKLLLNAKADFQIKNNDGQRPLHLASKQGDRRIVALLLGLDSLVATVNEPDKGKRTPLHLAIQTLRELQRQTSSNQPGLVDLTMKEEDNAEHQFLQCIRVIRILLAHGACPGAQTCENETALHLAVACCEPSILGDIMEKIKPEHLLVRNTKGYTALAYVLDLGGQWEVTAMKIFLRADSSKIAEFDKERIWDVYINPPDWAANDHESHDIVRLIL